MEFFFKGWLWNEKHATLWMLYVKRCRFSGSFQYLHPKEIHFSQLEKLCRSKVAVLLTLVINKGVKKIKQIKSFKEFLINESDLLVLG